VAATLAWDALDGERPHVTVRDAATRLALPDPWKDFEDARRPLTAAIRRRVGAA
jgi:DNA primase